MFTPSKKPERQNCLNCDVKMPADHQCETGGDKREAIGKGEDKAAENRMRRNLSKLIK